MNKTPRKKRVSKAEWLDAALEVLESEGVQGVRIERLARNLGIAKSGFYWHFRDREELLKSLLDHWAHEYTAVVTSNPDLLEGDPERRLDQTALMVLEHDLAKYDLPIRDWATHDRAAAEAVKGVTQARLVFSRSIFRDLGFRGRQLEMRARLFVSYLTWEQSTFRDLSKKERRALLHLRHKLLASR